jgi:DNA repair protein SbcC/Rad50
VRLALADLLFRTDRELVVLDDALTFTDSGRFARILGILDEAAARFQMLILTCHPERYSGLSEACFIDLEKTAESVRTSDRS